MGSAPTSDYPGQWRALVLFFKIGGAPKPLHTHKQINKTFVALFIKIKPMWLLCTVELKETSDDRQSQLTFVGMVYLPEKISR